MTRAATVSPHQLELDIEAALARLADQLRDRRNYQAGAERLLAELVRAGLDEDALLPAAALCVVMAERAEEQQRGRRP